MRRILAAVALAWVAVAAAPAAAQDPAGYEAPFADGLEPRVFPLFAMLRAAQGWPEALAGDRALQQLATERAERVPASGCAPAPRCLADAWRWTQADIALIEGRLRALAGEPWLAEALVAGQMRPSGRFARHAALGDAEFLSAAWRDAAAATNRVIDTYAGGDEPRYPAIDAIIFDVAAPEFAQVLEAHAIAIAALPRPDGLFFDPALRYAAGLLRMNERTDAGRFRPLTGGENAAAVRAVAEHDWAGAQHSALLVFGHGPEDPQSRTGVMAYIRMEIAAELFRQGAAPFIVVSGGTVHPNRTPFNEAVEMKRILIEEHGIPATRILMEPHARHTTTNLRNSARLLLAAGFPADLPGLVVSDHRTIQYIGSAVLAERNLAEMGVQPGRLSPGPDRFTLAFQPDPVAFHVEAADPLDP